MSQEVEVSGGKWGAPGPLIRTVTLPPLTVHTGEKEKAHLPPLTPTSAAERRAPPSLVIGVDVGNSGGLALVTLAGELVAVEPMPVLCDGPKGRPTVNAGLLAAVLRRWAPSCAYVELVGPRPGEAAGGAFSFGRARGIIEGALAAQGIPARMIAPAVWKRAVSIPAGREGAKDLARAEACRRWPSMAECFAARGSDGLAEAGLIAIAGLARFPITETAA